MGYASLVKTHLQKKNSLLNLIIKKDIEYVFNLLSASLSKSLTSRGGEPCAKEGLEKVPAATYKQQLGRPSATTLSQASLPLSALPEARLHAALSPENPAPRAPPPSPARRRCYCVLPCSGSGDLEVSPSPSDATFRRCASRIPASV